MRIISQSGTVSIDFDNAELIQQDDTILYQTAISKGRLGRYKTTEDANGVFMDIHKQYEQDMGFGTYEMPLEV